MPFKTRVFICEGCRGLVRGEGERKCALCDTPIAAPYGDNLCLLCKKQKRYMKRAFAPLIYKGAARSAVLRLKFSGKKAHAKTFARLIYDYIRREQPWLMPDIITYVPLGRARLRERGYNQAMLLGRELATLFGAPCAGLLYKTRETPPQSGLRVAARRANVRGAFCAREGFPLSSKCVLLVDDVLTTGSTLNECAKALLARGAGAVYCAAACVTEKF